MIRLAVLGDPVSHSKSPAIHTAALNAAGISGSYTARRVDPDGMRSAAGEVRAGALTGANITTPHKQLAADLADRRSDLVQRIGGANTWWLDRDGELVAENTDVAGVQYAFARIGDCGSILVLGAGAAAAAALVATSMVKDGISDKLYISTRNEEQARLLLNRLGLNASFVPWGTPIPGAVVVNATRLGMAGEALPEGLIDVAGALIDLPYGDEPTPAVLRALELDLPCSPGVDMLVGQALESFLVWTGVSVDPGIMVEAAGRRE